ncbi:hypothetical protein DFH28DRAFT_1218891 [Melampsora americana]|nr:hypothetical protein DFH28DRAFT_1218891 [Melampsora americana]
MRAQHTPSSLFRSMSLRHDLSSITTYTYTISLIVTIFCNLLMSPVVAHPVLPCARTTQEACSFDRFAKRAIEGIAEFTGEGVRQASEGSKLRDISDVRNLGIKKTLGLSHITSVEGSDATLTSDWLSREAVERGGTQPKKSTFTAALKAPEIMISKVQRVFSKFQTNLNKASSVLQRTFSNTSPKKLQPASLFDRLVDYHQNIILDEGDHGYIHEFVAE